MCDRVVVMIDGGIAADGTLAELISSDRVALSLGADGADPQTVGARLGAVEGVAACHHEGPDSANPGCEVWWIDCAAGANPTAALIDAAREAGFTVASAARSQRSLESYFRELQDEHVKQRGSQGAGDAS